MLNLHFLFITDDYAQKLLRKECFADQDHFSAQDPDQIIPKEYLAKRNNDIDFRAFRPAIVKLQTDEVQWHTRISDKLEFFINNIVRYYENFDNNLGKTTIEEATLPIQQYLKRWSMSTERSLVAGVGIVFNFQRSTRGTPHAIDVHVTIVISLSLKKTILCTASFYLLCCLTSLFFWLLWQ